MRLGVSLVFTFASSCTFSSFLCLTFRVDIYNRLYRERIIFLGSEIDDELANQVIGVMLYLDSEDSSKPIYLYINSPGGSVISGLAIFDCMQHIQIMSPLPKISCCSYLSPNCAYYAYCACCTFIQRTNTGYMPSMLYIPLQRLRKSYSRATFSCRT